MKSLAEDLAKNNQMIDNGYQKLMEIISNCQWIPKNVVEVGVGSRELCRSRPFWKLGSNCLLFEPNPESYAKIKETINFQHNVQLFPFAISDKIGNEEFIVNGDCSSLESVVSPANNESCNEKQRVLVETRKIDEFDNGDINLLLIDTEGGEWGVLKNLVSKPEVVVIETHAGDLLGNIGYQNSNLYEIEKWFKLRQYQLLFKDISDSFYIRNDIWEDYFSPVMSIGNTFQGKSYQVVLSKDINPVELGNLMALGLISYANLYSQNYKNRTEGPFDPKELIRSSMYNFIQTLSSYKEHEPL